MPSPDHHSDHRLDRLEELAFFQEERLHALDAALTAQQAQLDRLEKSMAQTADILRQLREKLADQPENATPPHFLPRHW